MKILSPVTGKIKTLKSLKDGVFSEGMLGKGLAITPTSNKVHAPMSGRLTTVFDTGHAYGITAKDGTTMLIHIGIDTVNLNGEGFTTKLKQGKKIKAGALLATVDFESIKSKVPSIDVITLVTPESKTTFKTITKEKNVTLKSIIFEVK